MTALWPEVPLTAVADLVRGVSYPKTDSRDDAAAGYVPILRATNIQDGRLVLESDLVYVAESNISPEQRLRPGDIVVATSSGSKHLVGKSALLHAHWNGSFGAFCAGIRPKPNIESRYLAYFLQSPRYWNEIGKKALGVNINNLRRGDLETLSLPLPPAESQREIVAEFEKQFSRLDEAVANLQRVKANLKRYVAAFLRAAFEGSLVVADAERAMKLGSNATSGESLEAWIRRSRRENWHGRGKWKDATSPGDDTKVELPEGWALVSWEAVLAAEDGAFKRGPFGSALTKAMFVDSGFKVYEQYCPINDDCSFARYYVTPEKFEQMRAFEVRAGDFLISCSGVTLGRITRVPAQFERGVINQALLRVRLNTEVLDPTYFLHLFRSPQFQRSLFDRSAGAAIPNLRGVDELKAIPIAVPPMAEQLRIVAEVDRRLSIVRDVEAEVDASLKRAQAFRQAVLGRAFDGGRAAFDDLRDEEEPHRVPA